MTNDNCRFVNQDQKSVLAKQVLPLFASLAFYSGAQATLIDRGSSLIHDNVFVDTWLQDANYAKISGDSPTGILTYRQATNWASSFVYQDRVRNVIYSDWRLPSVSPIGGNWNYSFSAVEAQTGIQICRR